MFFCGSTYDIGSEIFHATQNSILHSFFFIYHVFGVLIVLNLIQTIVINCYSENLNKEAVKERIEDDEQEATILKQLSEKIQQDKVLHLISSNKSVSTKSNEENDDLFLSEEEEKERLTRMISIRRRNSSVSDVRSNLGIKSETISLEDMKACKKYFPAYDLVKGYKDMYESTRDE